MGRPKKSPEIKKLEGTYRKDRDLNQGIRLEPLEKMPAPDSSLSLSKKARDYWYCCGNFLIQKGIMTMLDLNAFGRLCGLYDTCLEMERQIQENGYTAFTSSGKEYQRPAVAILKKAESEMLKLEDRFGLSPYSRHRIPVETKDMDNPFLKKLASDRYQ